MNKKVDVRFYYEGEFKKTMYVGGKTVLVDNVDVDIFSYTVLMELVKEYLGCTEIGGVYISKGKSGDWQLVSNDADLMSLIEKCNHREEIPFYIDNTIDEGIQPLIQMQPHIIVRPRKNIIQASAKKPLQKRQFVTTHQLQQQRKLNKKSPEVGKIDTSAGHGEKHATVNEKSKARRKLALQKDETTDKMHENVSVDKLPPPPPLPLENLDNLIRYVSEDEVSKKLPPPSPLNEDDISEELPPQPHVTNYELGRIRRMQQNDEVCKILGVPALVASIRNDGLKSKGKKGKDKKEKEPEDCDSLYTPDDEQSSDDLLETTKTMKPKEIVLGPRTRSRANATPVIARPATEENVRKVTSQKEVASQKEVTSQKEAASQKKSTSSSRPALVKPTCTKIFKQSINDEAPAGTVAAYLALRERQKRNEAARVENDAADLNLEDPELDVEIEEVQGPKNPRGPTRMSKVHSRSPDEKKTISLNEKGQAISENQGDVAELSNFLGTLARDNVSLTYINWHLVPEQLKQKLWDYTLVRYDIPEDGKKWVYGTMNAAWKLHKSRIKQRYYTRYNTDEERLANRTERIPLEDFKLLMKYWGEESVQKLAKDNAEHRKALVETHTMGRKPVSLLVEDMKKTDPNQALPSEARIYKDTRKRKDGRQYMSNTEDVNSKITKIQELIEDGKDDEANVVACSGKKRSRNWLVGRAGQKCPQSTPPAATEDHVHDLKEKIRSDIEAELESKVNKKVQENMALILKRLAQANPDINFDIGDICATISSDQDDSGTPFTHGGSTS